VAKLLKKGLSPREIADVLNVWPQAVYAIKRRIEQGENAPAWAKGGDAYRKVPA
jgi:transposase